MKILWLTSVRLNSSSSFTSGTWIQGMIELQHKFHDDVDIVIVSRGSKNKVLFEETDWGKQWVIPENSMNRLVKLQDALTRIIAIEKPDIIQVWGTESIWGAVPFDDLCPMIPVIIEMQGLIQSVCDVFYGELTFGELFKCFSVKECLKPSSFLYFLKKRYMKSLKREEYIIKKAKIVSVQSEWVEAYVKAINPYTKIFHTGIALRNEFYLSNKWSIDNINKRVIFSTAITSVPLKGAYTLIKAFKIVKEIYPDALLVLGGGREEGIKKSGYRRLIDKFVKKYGLEESIIYKGALNTGELIECYLNCSVFVNPSHVESYSLVVAEAMYLGTPVVATSAGAMCELGINDSVLYFPKSDYVMCAHQIIKVFSNENETALMSQNAINVSEKRQSCQVVSDAQYNIYKSILSR